MARAEIHAISGLKTQKQEIAPNSEDLRRTEAAQTNSEIEAGNDQIQGLAGTIRHEAQKALGHEGRSRGRT
jgi:hypothetical protein